MKTKLFGASVIFVVVIIVSIAIASLYTKETRIKRFYDIGIESRTRLRDSRQDEVRRCGTDAHGRDWVGPDHPS